MKFEFKQEEKRPGQKEEIVFPPELHDWLTEKGKTLQDTSVSSLVIQGMYFVRSLDSTTKKGRPPKTQEKTVKRAAA